MGTSSSSDLEESTHFADSSVAKLELSSSLTAQPFASHFETARLIFTVGSGILADGYDLTVINIGLSIMQQVYPEVMGPAAKGFIVSMTMVGVVVGQLVFGTIGDVLGRKGASITTAILVTLGAGLSACCFNSSGWGGIVMQLGLCRFVLGIGIGGEYPLSAALGLEIARNDGVRGSLSRSQLLAINMTMFSIGSVMSGLFVLPLLAAEAPLAIIWRIALAGGMLPSAVAFALRFKMHIEDDQADQAQTSASREVRQDGAIAKGRWSQYVHQLPSALGARWLVLLGACLAWCVYNMVSYSTMSFSHIVVETLFPLGTASPVAVVRRDALFALLLNVAQVCASLLVVVYVNKWTCFHIQLIGFTGMMLAMMALPRMDASWVLLCLMVVWACCNSFVSVSTYMIPAENFPAVIRATCVGLAAASGKVGAALGTAVFPTLEASQGLGTVMTLGGGLCFVGVVVTFLSTPRTTVTSVETTSSRAGSSSEYKST